MRSRMRVDGAISSYDGGASRYGAHPVGLGQAGRSRSNPYGGYSDTEAMGPSAGDRYYGRDPYYDSRAYDERAGYGGQQPYYNDRRAAAPPPPPRDRDFAAVGDPYRQRGPLRQPQMDPTRSGEMMGSGVHLGPRHPTAEFFDSDMESVTSAFSSQSAPHVRGKRPG